MVKINLNENKNEVELTEEKKKKLGILKVLNVVISEDEETKYNCIMEDGTIKTISASELE